VGDVFGLGRLVAATQQENHYALAPREVHAIASADIDAHFTHALSDEAHNTKVAKASGLQPGEDARLSTRVAQLRQSVAEDIGLAKLVHGSLYPCGYDWSSILARLAHAA